MTIRKLLCLAFPQKFTGKRTDIIKRNQPNAGDLSGAHGYTVVMNTTYYVSFEIEDGERKRIYCRSFNIQYVIGRNERDTVIQGNKILYLSSDRRFLDKCLIQAKAPGTAIPRAFFSVLLRYHEPRLVAVIYSCLTICRYSGRLYQPWQKLRTK